MKKKIEGRIIKANNKTKNERSNKSTFLKPNVDYKATPSQLKKIIPKQTLIRNRSHTSSNYIFNHIDEIK